MIHSPVFEMLLKYGKKNTERFHMPGHKGKDILFGGVGADLVNLDVTEIDDTDNLLNPKGAFREAMHLMEKRAKSRKSYFLTGGATEGNHTMIMALLKEGDKVLVDRFCHISVFSALSFSGATPAYIENSFAHRGGVLGCVKYEDVKKAVEENPDAKAVFITSPNSFGFTAPLREISLLCKKHNMLLLTDEAHGAHYPYCDILPESAVEQGADASVVSFHKTMPSLTQSAVLHIGNSGICPKIEETLHMLMTSSSSFLIAASIDYGRAYMEEYGDEKIRKLAKIIRENRPHNVLLTDDILRICAAVDGEKYISLFRENGIEPEMFGKGFAVFIVTVADDEEKVLKLLNLLKTLPETDYGETLPPEAEIKITPRQAYLSEGEEISLDMAEGRVLKKAIYAYPPGVPCAAPGEVLSGDMIKYIKERNLEGEEKGRVWCVK